MVGPSRVVELFDEPLLLAPLLGKTELTDSIVGQAV